MAEKKFSGAPFGTQTARFDVTGVHPNKKIPGTFTQIPYDKPSTMELSKQTTWQEPHKSEILQRLDSHLQKIKESLSSAKESVKEIAKINNGIFLKDNESNVDLFGHSNSSKTPDAIEANQKQEIKCANETHKEEHITHQLQQRISHKNIPSQVLSSLYSDAGCGTLNEKIVQQDSEIIMSNARSAYPPEDKNSFNVHSKLCNMNASKSCNTSNNKLTGSGSPSNAPSQEHIPSVLQLQSQSGHLSASKLGGKSPGGVSQSNSCEPVVSASDKKSEEKMGKGKDSSKVLSFLCQRNNGVVNVDTLHSEIAKVIRMHTAPHGNKQASSSVKKLAMPSKTVQAQNVQRKPTVHIEKCMASKTDSRKAEAPKVNGDAGLKSPFPAWTKRLSTLSSEDRNSDSTSLCSTEKRIGLRNKLRGAYAEKCETLLRRKLGPGAYNIIVGGFSSKSVDNRASGPGWARQLEVERLASLPHLLYKEQWEENKMLKRKLGPGSYEIKDFIQKADEKPRSGRGICDNLAPRFEKTLSSATPGPGTYGVGGVPQRAIEEKDFQSTSTKGMLDKGDRKRTLPSVGSHLGPGTYRHKTCTDELLNKVTSLKGPYKLYSGDRNKPITEGYLAAPQLADLGPGQYEIGSFVDEQHSKERRIHGKFGKMAQYPEVPTDRLFLFSQAHCNRRDVPGPGAYSLQDVSKPTAVNSPGFLSSAKRDDKMSQKFFTRNFNPVGAGRYDVQKFDEAQDINGHSSVFKSKTGKPNLQMSKFLQERIRGKDVSVEDRVVLNQSGKMTRSITCM